MAGKRLRVGNIALAGCVLAFFAWMLVWQYSLFVSGQFGYHDLTLISDWFSNALVHARPFWWTNEQKSFLAVHFIPSLLLLTPIFALFSGQFALIAISTSAVCAGIYIATRDQHRALTLAGLHPLWTGLLTATFLLVFALNRYTERILSSAHFEPLFVLTAFWLLHALRRGWSYNATFAILFLTLGIKEDAGFDLFFLLLACMVAPHGWRMPRRKLCMLAATCVLYVGLVSTIVLPWFGTTEGTWAWRSWGNTWPQVFEAFVRSPVRVWHAIQGSEFDAFNREFSYLPMFSPLAWLANQLAATFLYTADSPAKSSLEFYNASFLLPGIMLCFGFAQLHALGFVLKHARANSRGRDVALGSLCAVFIGAALHAASPDRRNALENGQIAKLTRSDPFVDQRVRDIVGCSKVHSIAADYRDIVFAPLGLDKYLLTNATLADVVLIPRHIDQRAPGAVRESKLIRRLSHAGNYGLVLWTQDYEVFERAGAICSSS
jgi:uncharacterized membrane protein